MTNITNRQTDGNPSLADVALSYVSRFEGRRFIFPIKAGAKFPPLIRDNLNAASNDPEQIKRWAAKWPGCNWGLANKKSGTLVVDVDVKPGKVGQATYDGLDVEFGFPKTETVETPSGGRHYYYEGEHVFALGLSGFGQDIDSPNYVLIAGCQFKDGSSYSEPVILPTAPTEPWFYEVLGRDKKVRVENPDEVVVDLDTPSNIAWAQDHLRNDAPPSIEGQNGDQTTFNVAATLRDNGISETKAVELMNDIYNERCEPIWDLDDLIRKVANAYTYANQSKIGGRTAEADFADDDVEEVIASIKPDNPNATSPGKAIWLKRCAVIVQPASFVDINSKRMLSNKSFNMRYGADGGSEAHKKAIKSKSIKRYEGVCYRPGADEVAKIDGFDHFNMYRAQAITPLEDEPKLFLSHMAYLIPDEVSREYLLDWLAWVIQRPDRKTMFAVLLLGATRTGKSWVGDLLKVLLGEANCSEPNKKRVASEFNSWLSFKRVIIVHELYERGAKGLYDALKDLITQKTVDINPKGIEPFKVENFANFLTITNQDDALPLDDNDGRYLVVRCADEPRFGRGESRSQDYYNRLFACIGTPDAPGDEARRVLGWLQRRDIKLNCENVAPDTEAKAEMVDAQRSNLEKFLRSALEVKSPPLSCPLINPSDVLAALPYDIEGHSRNLRAVEAALRELGARSLTKLGQVRTASGRKRLWALDGRRVSYFLKKTRTDVATIYDDGRTAQARVDAEQPVNDFEDDPTD